MTAIAAQAGVALNTVYASVGRKPDLARLLIETAISGTSQAIPADERDYVRAIQAPPTPERGSPSTPPRCGISPQARPVLGIVQQAAPAEPELAELWREIAERRAANMRRFINAVAAVGPLRVEPGEAADIVWATNAPELYQLLAGQRGWTPERYEHFLADTWQRLLLAD